MNAVTQTAYNLSTLAINAMSSEAVGRYNDLFPGTGALVGLVNFSIHAALEPAWTAVALSAHLNPVANVLFVVVRVIFEAVISTQIVQSVFRTPINTTKATVVGAESGIAAQVSQYLMQIGLKAART